MEQNHWLADQFEASRGHLRGVAYRMLGSLAEADDAVQEAWLRLSRSGADGIENLRGWLTTVVSRVCLDMLRSRVAQREEPLEGNAETEPVQHKTRPSDPEQEAILADSVGLALLVVLDRLNPAERLAFVLHDLFDFSFDEIAPIVDRSPEQQQATPSKCTARATGHLRPSQPPRVRGLRTPPSSMAKLAWSSRRADGSSALYASRSTKAGSPRCRSSAIAPPSPVLISQ